LPSTAVVWQKGVAYGFVVQKSEQGYTFERRALTIGAHNENWSEIINADADLLQYQWVLKGADQLQAQLDLFEGDEE
jgi:hypothetical protein